MSDKAIQWISVVLAVGVGLYLFVIDRGTSNVIFSLILGVVLVVLLYLEAKSRRDVPWIERLLRWSTLGAVILYLLVFSHKYAVVSLAYGYGLGVTAAVLYGLTRSRARSWVMAIAIIALLSVVLESGLRKYAPREAGRWGEYPALQLHPTRGFALIPNKRTRLRWGSYDHVVETNSYGLNSPEIDPERADPKTLRIMICGDGMTMPNGTDRADAYPARLEELLKEKLKPRDVQVINAGVTAYCPVEILPQLREIAPVFKPDLVIYQFSPSEFDEIGIDQVLRIKSSGLLPKGRSFRLKILESLQIIARYRQVDSKVRAILRGEGRGRLQRNLYGKYYQKNGNKLYNQENLEKMKAYLKKMKAVCDEIGAQFVIGYVPEVVEVDRISDDALAERREELRGESGFELNTPFFHARRLAAALDIPFFDLTPNLLSHRDHPLYYRKARHWNKEGHKTAAEAICRVLLCGFVSAE